MKFCQNHWDVLMQAVKDRGLWDFVAKTGEQAAQNQLRQLQGEDSNEIYDPLMACHWMIVNAALAAGGLYLMMADENGNEYCPVCEAVKHGQQEKFWIDGPADAVFEECKRRGMVVPS